MKLSSIRKIKLFCDSLFSTPDWREVVASIDADEDDFEVGGVRFITEDSIDAIQANEMESDEYVLGCFNSSAIADATGWPQALIEAAQKGEAYQEIGEAMTKEDIEALQRIYSRADGYGHHFNRYDFSEEYVRLNGKCFYVFDNH